MTWLIPLLCGATIGAGVWLLVREAVPADPHLKSALDRLAGTSRPTPVTLDPAASLTDRVGAAAVRYITAPVIPQLTPSRADLDLIEKAPHTHLGEKVLAAAAAALAAPILSVLAVVAGLSVSVTVPLGAAILFGVAGWVLPDVEATSKARAARADFTRAVGAYLELLAIERMSGAGATQATEGAAEVAQSWPFRRIAQTLQRARWAGKTPWAALHELSDELAVPALHDVADIMRLAGAEGTAVVEQLRGRARSMRGTQMSLERAAANDASTRMNIPMAATVIVFTFALVVPIGMQALGMAP
ncbi:type II secretion system F family protein [uncultured Cellulomonas sp.]|uniref:type II secretion system F family protein n=1 Tax=uncultured Cellulomonas sp. TaxID=189682 RepID=UPI00261BE5E0|nr:type II secretion system F family protein [uncultured Cellulomonas sp.]